MRRDFQERNKHASARACANMYTLTRTDTSGLHLLPLCLHLLPSLYTSVYNNMQTHKQTYARTSKLYTNVYVYTSLTTRTVQLCMFMCAPLVGETLVACCVSTSWHKIQWQKRGKVWLLVKLQREEALAQAEEACLSSLAHMSGRNQELQQSSDEAMTQRTESAHCTRRPPSEATGGSRGLPATAR